MKFKRLVLSALATSVLVGAPLSYAAKQNDRLEQRMKYRSNLSCEAVQGAGAFSKEWIDANISDDADYNEKEAYNKALIHLTAIQCDVLRDVAYGWKLPEITATAYIADPEVEVPEGSESDDSKLEIIHQKDVPALKDKTSQQLAHDWQEKTGEKTVALVCANAQYKLGRVFDSSSHEEATAQDAVNLIDYETDSHGVCHVYYGNGRDVAYKERYNAANSMVMNNVTFFKDKCLPAISDFRCGVCKSMQENPNALSTDDLMQANLLFHAAADQDQVKTNGGSGYFYDELVHIFKVCKKEDCKWVVLKPFGTGSFAVDPKAAVKRWYDALTRALRIARALGIGVIIADDAPKAPKPEDKNAFIKEQKRITKKMLDSITRKSPVAGSKVEGPWGI